MFYYQVLLQIPVNIEFIYASNIEIDIGTRVEVSLSTKSAVGLIIKEVKNVDRNIEYKNIINILDEKPIFSDLFIKFLNSLADYYQINLQLAFMKLIPKSIFSDNKIYYEQKNTKKTDKIELNNEQSDIYNHIKKFLLKGYSTHLIEGITGSGKTEIYMELAEDVMNQGKQVLYLVPEISLTSQLIKRLSARLGVKVPAYHSRLSPKKRKEVFWSYSEANLNFLIGARSALFIPAKNLGLIIIDEEHENSYKQEDSPFYHLRDMAVMYGSILDIPVILGSATPSLSSYYNAKKGKYHFYQLKERFNRQLLPKIEIIDMKNSDIIENILSTRLYDEIFNTVNKGEQVILLLNRKGYSSQLICRKCGLYFSCPNCSVSMIYYKSASYSKCSYCGEKVSFIRCQNCNSNDLINYGYGTEKAFELLNSLFKDKVLKIDMDDVTSQRKLDKMLKDFEEKKYNILIGTQIIAKGLNFEDVTLVGVLNIDHQFAIPDFRANEKAFQLLLQVAGRAGRFQKKGKVAIQTFNSEMPLFSMLNDDISVFYEYELDRRKELDYPPFSKLVRIVIYHTNTDELKKISNIIANELKNIKNLLVLGPVSAPVFKIKNKFRYNLLLKSNSFKTLNIAGNLAKDTFESNKQGAMQIRIDVDPYSFM